MAKEVFHVFKAYRRNVVVKHLLRQSENGFNFCS